MTSKPGVGILEDERQEERGEDPFDVFSLPPINTDYEKHVDLFVEPTSNITQKGPIVFKWETLGGERWDANKTEIETTYKIMKGATKTTVDDNVSVINSLPITHWDKIELKMNDKIVTDSSSGNHAYHAYLAQKNTYNKNVKREILKSTEFYFEEEVDKMNQNELKVSATDNSPINDSFRQRHNVWVKNTKELVTRAQVYLDVCNVHKYYPTDIDFVMTLTRNPEAFCLMSKAVNEGEYKIVITRIRLLIRTIIPAKHIIDREAAYFKKSKAYMPYTHSTMTTDILQGGTITKTFTDVCGTQPSLPKQLFVFFVDHLAFSGEESFIKWWCCNIQTYLI